MAGKDRPLVVLPYRSRDEPAGWGVLEVGQVMKIVTSGPRMRTRGIGCGNVETSHERERSGSSITTGRDDGRMCNQ
jgi:hypothetical protein